MNNLPNDPARGNPERLSINEAWARLRATPIGEAFAHARTAYENAPDRDQLDARFDELWDIWAKMVHTPEGVAYLNAGGRISYLWHGGDAAATLTGGKAPLHREGDE